MPSSGVMGPPDCIKSYTYPAIKSLTSPTPGTAILIDVREPREFASGHIPSARNLPIGSRPDGLFLPPEEFQDTFGWEKPDVSSETELVFYCKAGIRSRSAARIAREAGYVKVGEYPGSWIDWIVNEYRQRQK